MKNKDFFNKFYICDLCGSKQFKVIINRKSPSMTSDRKKIPYPLKKMECKKCGLVCNTQIIKSNKIEENYKKNYSYNTGKFGDSFFFGTLGSQKRSSQIFEWIIKNIPKNNLSTSKSIIEVGCGQGTLLSKFVEKFPKKKIIGLEFNKEAIRIGRKRGLDIRSLEGLKKFKADIVISNAVIEHTVSPKKFLKSLSEMLSSKGILVTSQPNQDRVYYDIFFWDHLFHFSSKHIEDYGRSVNLVQIKKSKMKWPVNTFSIHCFRKAKNNFSPKIYFRKTQILKSINYYEKIFKKINLFLKKNTQKNDLAVFGLGEIFSLFFTYTDLNKTKIKFGIDDFPLKNHFPFPVIPSLELRKYPIDTILCCVNPNYYEIISKKLGSNSNKVFFPFC